jgi:anaerobic magnesium-protoporphyrin IX monomethyl ester cyclase
MFKMVKEHSKDIITVTGGPHFSGFDPDDYEDIDYIVRGDGEIALTYLADGNVPDTNVLEMLPDDGVYDAPMIRWNEMEDWPYNFMFHARLEPTAAILTSRGCPYKCTFCHNSKNFRKVRFRNISNIIEEVRVVKSMGINHLVFLDETFSLKKERTIELCKELAKCDVEWKCLTRADRVDHEVISAMAEAGCVGISIGVESGNEDIITASKKMVTKEQVRLAYAVIEEYPQIEKRGSFIIGHPYETRSTVEETIDFACSLPIDVAFFNIMTPYPSSMVYDQAIRGEGIHIVDEDWSHYKRAGVSTIRTDELSPSDLMDLQKMALTKFFTRPSVIKYHLKNLIKTADQEYCTRPLLEVLEWEINK